MISVKKTVLTAVITAAFTVGVAYLAFFSHDSFAATTDNTTNSMPESAVTAPDSTSPAPDAPVSEGTQTPNAQNNQDTIGQSVGKGIDQAIQDFNQLSEKFNQNLDQFSSEFAQGFNEFSQSLEKGLEDASRSWDETKKDLSERFAAIQRENDGEMSSSADPYGYIRTVQRGVLEQYSPNVTVGGVMHAYSDCTPHTKRWENFTTVSGENLVIFSCTLPQAAEQFKAIAPEPKTGLNSLFQSAEEELQTQAAQEVKTADLVVIFAMSKVDSSSFTPQNFYLHVSFAQGGGSDVDLDLSQLQALYANQQLLPAVASNEVSKSALLQELVTAYQEVQANRSQNPNSVQ